MPQERLPECAANRYSPGWQLHDGHRYSHDQSSYKPWRTPYAGPMEVGEDLRRIDIGDTVTVQRDGR